MKKQSGQTLIETIVAIFILTTAITAGLALTIYILANSGQSINEVIATNLATEGVEVIRTMRDTNWLESEASGGQNALSSNCSDPNVSASPYTCYPKAWQGIGGGFHNFDFTHDDNYAISFDPLSREWSLVRHPSSYLLYLLSNGTYSTSVSQVAPIFSRKISISHTLNSNPFGDTSDSASELVVTSVVGWSGRGCSAMTGNPPDPSTTNCTTAVTERLTNWKDY